MRIKEYIWRKGDIVNQIELKISMNRKLGLGDIQIHTYHFSIDQIKNNDLTLDKHNCKSCKFSYNQNGGKSGGCYTHRNYSLMGLKSKLGRLHRMNTSFERFNKKKFNEFIEFCKTYEVNLLRFGSYGEGISMTLNVIEDLISISKNYNSYTHQWHLKSVQPYKERFMASCDNPIEEKIAQDMGWKTFTIGGNSGINCPASKEAGKKTTCNSCALCGGVKGKGNVSIWINKH